MNYVTTDKTFTFNGILPLPIPLPHQSLLEPFARSLKALAGLIWAERGQFLSGDSQSVPTSLSQIVQPIPQLLKVFLLRQYALGGREWAGIITALDAVDDARSAHDRSGIVTWTVVSSNKM